MATKLTHLLAGYSDIGRFVFRRTSWIGKVLDAEGAEYVVSRKPRAIPTEEQDGSVRGIRLRKLSEPGGRVEKLHTRGGYAVGETDDGRVLRCRFDAFFAEQSLAEQSRTVVAEGGETKHFCDCNVCGEEHEALEEDGYVPPGLQVEHAREEKFSEYTCGGERADGGIGGFRGWVCHTCNKRMRSIDLMVVRYAMRATTLTTAFQFHPGKNFRGGVLIERARGPPVPGEGRRSWNMFSAAVEYVFHVDNALHIQSGPQHSGGRPKNTAFVDEPNEWENIAQWEAARAKTRALCAALEGGDVDDDTEVR